MRLLPLFLNILTAVAATAVLFLAIGVSPWMAFEDLAVGAFGSGDGIGYTLFYTTDFIFAGLAVALPYRAGLFNIGAEGQIAIGGIAIALVCRAMPAAAGLMVIPVAMLAAAVGGALWAAIPALLQVSRNSNVVITTIMFNFLAAAISTWVLVDVIRAPGDPSPETAAFGGTASLPILLADTPLNMSLFLALALAVIAWIGLRHSYWGFALRVVGECQGAARYAGIPVGRIQIWVMCIGGAAAGMMAINEVLGAEHRLILGFSAGFGFIGIAVALMANCDPLGVVVAALLFGALYQGGTELALDTPKVSQDVIMAINGLAVLICGGVQTFWSRRLRLGGKQRTGMDRA